VSHSEAPTLVLRAQAVVRRAVARSDLTPMRRINLACQINHSRRGA
jgi:hypothetical protein